VNAVLMILLIFLLPGVAHVWFCLLCCEGNLREGIHGYGIWTPLQATVKRKVILEKVGGVICKELKVLSSGWMSVYIPESICCLQ